VGVVLGGWRRGIGGGMRQQRQRIHASPAMRPCPQPPLFPPLLTRPCGYHTERQAKTATAVSAFGSRFCRVHSAMPKNSIAAGE